MSCGKPRSIGGEQVRFRARREVILMRVPALVGDGDEPHARLDQPPGQETALPEPRPTIPLTQAVIFLLQLEAPALVFRGP